MLKVLIVDNEAAIRKGLVHCIDWAGLGCSIEGQASDGFEAMAQVEELSPDIVISDIRMPGMDGMELAKKLHETKPGVKVIILTGYPDFNYARQAIAYGVVDFVLKPTSSEHLAAAVGLAKSRIAEEQEGRDIVRRLEAETEQNTKLQQSLFLNELMHQTDLSTIYTLNLMSELGLAITGGYHVLRLALRGGGAETDYAPMQAEVHTLVAQCLSDVPLYFVPRGGQRSYVVAGSTDTAAVLRAAAEVAQIVDGLLPFSVSVGVSGLQNDPMQMPQAARQARAAQQFAEYSPDSQALAFEEIPAAGSEELAALREQLGRFGTAAEHGTEAQAQKLLADIFDTIRAARLPLREVEKIGALVYHACVEPLAFRPGGIGDDLPSAGQILAAETVDEIENHLRGFLAQSFRQNRHSAEEALLEVQTVQNHICRHYRDDLTLELLAGLVYLSPSYLSKLFKRETGETLTGYIQMVRIEKAKELLVSTQLKAYEVAEQVGIANPVYFSRLFKKMTGVKPMEYRLQRGGGEPGESRETP